MEEKTVKTGPDVLLQDHDFDNIIHHVATAVYRSLKAGMISLPFYVSDPALPEMKADIIHDIKAEIILFIQENTADLASRIRSAGMSAAPYLKTSFINHCKDRLRTKRSSTSKYFYKRVSDVLRNSGSFYTTVRQTNVSSFSKSKRGRPVPPLTEEDFAQIPFLIKAASLDFDSVNQKKNICYLAEYFLNQLSKTCGGMDVQVDIRDFILWIGLHVDIADKKNGAAEYADDMNCAHQAAESDLSSSGDKYRPDRIYEDDYFDSATVKTWAKNFSAGLSQKEKLVFYLRHDRSLSLDKISVKAGYKGPSGAKHKIDRLNQKLCFFLRDLPWLSPDSNGRVNEEAFSLFLDDLLKTLKSSIEKP